MGGFHAGSLNRTPPGSPTTDSPTSHETEVGDCSGKGTLAFTEADDRCDRFDSMRSMPSKGTRRRDLKDDKGGVCLDLPFFLSKRVAEATGFHGNRPTFGGSTRDILAEFAGFHGHRPLLEAPRREMEEEL